MSSYELFKGGPGKEPGVGGGDVLREAGVGEWGEWGGETAHSLCCVLVFIV